jgi:peptidoglycan hydrolase-like protein with peptidoglycan-binding domain
MTKRTWLCAFGAVLLLSAAPILSCGGNAAAAQSAVPKKKKAASKKKSKPAARGQKAPTPDRVRDIQSALNREGALDGAPTGKWDDASVNALKKYQADHGLNPTGKIDALTLEKLGLGSETAGKGAPVPSASSADPPPAPAR